MNCKHCGYPVNRGQKTCPSCGRKVRRGNGWRVLLVIVLLLAAAVFGILHYRDVLNGVVERRLDLLSYYRYVEEQNYDDLSGLTSRLAGKKTLLSAPDGRSDTQIGFRLSDEAQQLIAAANPTGLPLDWIRSLGLSLETNLQGGRVGALLGLKLNDVGLLSVNAAFDREPGVLALTVPELSEEVILTDLGELGLGGEGSDLGELLGTLGSLPDGSKLRQIGRRYLEYALEQIENVEKGSGRLTAAGLEADCATLTVRMTDGELAALARSLCLRLSGDEEVLALAEQAAAARGKDPAEARAALADRLDRLGERLGQFRSRGGTFAMVLSLDGGGRILGREIRLETERTEAVYSRALLVRGGRFGLEIRGAASGESLALIGSGRVRGVALTGSFRTERGGAPMLTLDVRGALRGILRGELEMILKPERALLRALGLSDTVESLAKDLNLRLYFSNAEDPKAFSLVLRQDETALVTAEISRHALPAAEIVVPESGLSLDKWLSGLKMPGLLTGNGSFGTLFENLQQAGMPSTLIMILKPALSGLFR